jgi:hypothetical protein
VLAEPPKVPEMLIAGRSCASATPIWLWASAASSAARMSGRRRSRSAGIPTVIVRGGVGIPRDLASRWAQRLSALRPCANWISSLRIADWVASRTVVASNTSSSLVPPP